MAAAGVLGAVGFCMESQDVARCAMATRPADEVPP